MGLQGAGGWRGARRRLLVLLLLPAGACSRCPSGADDGDAGNDAGCTAESCTALCLDALGCTGRCRDGTCFCYCLDGGDSADGEAGDGPSETDAEVDADARREDAFDGRDGSDAGDCTYRSTGETRPQAAPERECRRVSVPDIEYGLMRFAADRGRIVAVGGPDDSVGLSVWLYDRITACWSSVPEVAGPEGERRGIPWVAVEGERLAFWATWFPEPETQQCELRLLNFDTREVVLLETVVSPLQSGRLTGCTMDSIALEYPWVVWRDIRRVSELFYPWDAMARNVETGETINLSNDPDTGERVWGSVVEIDLKGGLAVFNAAWRAGSPSRVFMEIVGEDLITRERRQITGVEGEQFAPAVTEHWVAWVDLRADDTGSTSMLACLGDLYGYDRRTGTEHPLVIEGDVMHGPWLDAEGPWLVYTDQRWDPAPRCDSDREASVAAFHLPTATEVRITDWPGWEAAPKAYRREDGRYGVLFIEEVSYGDGIYRLWDCDLPEL